MKRMPLCPSALGRVGLVAAVLALGVGGTEFAGGAFGRSSVVAAPGESVEAGHIPPATGPTGTTTDKPMPVWADARVAVAHGQLRPRGEGERTWAVAVSGPGAEWVLSAPAGGWDLSRVAELRIRVRNDADRPLTFTARARNAGADNRLDTVWGSALIAAGSEGDLVLRLVRRPELPGTFGEGKFPGAKQKVEVRIGTIDPGAVESLALSSPAGREGDAFTVVSIRPGGAGGPGPVPFFPFVDGYGQYIHRDWEGKIHDDDELRAGSEAEIRRLKAMNDPPGWDRAGGWADGPRLRATGHFRAEKYDGRWWLVTPEGALFFSVGPVGVRSTESGILTGREGWYRDLPDRERFALAFASPTAGVGRFDPDTTTAVSFLRANLMKKYGEQWRRRSAEVVHLRLRKHGLNTMGNWSERDYYIGGTTPYTVPVVYRSRSMGEGWTKVPDIYDPGYADALDRGMREAATGTANDPLNIGYFVDNELNWGTTGRRLGDLTMTMPADQPAKLELVRQLKEKYASIESLNAAWGSSHASWEALLADRTKPPATAPAAVVTDLTEFQTRMTRDYFRLSRDVVRRHAPNKLYLGCRMASYCGFNPSLFATAAEFCDVVSFNIYRWSKEVDEFAAKYDRPIIIGEFGYLPRGVTPFNTVGAPGTLPDRGGRYTEYVRGVLARPNFVGCHWYLYADQVVTGRGDGEASPTGFVTVTDQAKPDLFGAARVIAEDLYPARSKAPARR